MRRRGGVAAFTLALWLAACGGASEGRGHGVVRGVDATRGEITIDHGEIPGMMAAMTMSFAVADPALLEGVAVGREVDFRVREEGGRYTLTELAPASGGSATP